MQRCIHRHPLQHPALQHLALHQPLLQTLQASHHQFVLEIGKESNGLTNEAGYVLVNNLGGVMHTAAYMALDARWIGHFSERSMHFSKRGWILVKNKTEHALLKAVLSAKGSFDMRKDMRQKIRDMAVSQLDWREMLECEKKNSGESEEPLQISMT